MTDSAAAVVLKLIDSWSNVQTEDVGTYLSDDAVWINGPRGTYHGIDAVRSTFKGNVSGLSNFSVDIKAVVSDGTTVMVERVDKFELGGKPFGLELVGVFDVGRDGRITRWREYYDLRSFEAQLEVAGISITG
jgi:limonene-1,2-epoxide hydrolase